MKGTVLILGATGGVGSVVTQICAKNPEVFQRIVGASRDISKYEKLNKRLAKPIEFYEADASDKQQLVKLFAKVKPELVINVGIPYWNLNVQDACLETQTNGMDTAVFEPEDEARIRHDEQWYRHKYFKKAGLTYIIGCGFDPGVTNGMVAYARRFFRILRKIQIWDCNGGDHHKLFASNFNLVINLRELLAIIKYIMGGQWIHAPFLIDLDAIHHTYDFEEIGNRELYLMSHEELESLHFNFPEISEMSFWMTFGEQYLRCLRMFREIGMTSINKVSVIETKISPLEFLKLVIPDVALIRRHYQLLKEVGLLSEERTMKIDEGIISPLEFLQRVLPEPSSLGENYTGKTNIGVIFEGIGFDGKPKRYRMFNICDHAECFRETGSQAISFTTGAPAAAGAEMILLGHWRKPGVYNVEELNPLPFLGAVKRNGLPIREQLDREVPRAFDLF